MRRARGGGKTGEVRRIAGTKGAGARSFAGGRQNDDVVAGKFTARPNEEEGGPGSVARVQKELACGHAFVFPRDEAAQGLARPKCTPSLSSSLVLEETLLVRATLGRLAKQWDRKSSFPSHHREKRPDSQRPECEGFSSAPTPARNTDAKRRRRISVTRARLPIRRDISLMTV